jgi:hypothetical protein
LQEGYHILPNVWRGAQQAAEDSSEDELEDGVMTRMAVAANKEGTKRATTKPATPGTVTPNTPSPATPTTPAAPNPFTIDKARQPAQQK